MVIVIDTRMIDPPNWFDVIGTETANNIETERNAA